MEYDSDSLKTLLKNEDKIHNIIVFISHDFTHFSYQKEIDSYNNEVLLDVVNEIYNLIKELIPKRIEKIENLEKI